MAIITNVGKLCINEITEMQEAGKILVIDDNNIIQWINANELDVFTPIFSDNLSDI